MKKQLLSALLAGCLVVGCIGPVSAEEITTSGGTGETPVKLTAEAMTFSVTVPTSLPVGVAADGTVNTANNVEIVNNGAGPVKVKSVKVEAVAPWELAGDFVDLSAEKVGADKFSFSIQDANVAENGTCAADFDVIPAKGNITFAYKAKVAPQNEATTDEQMAKVVFTLGWQDNVIGEWDVSENSDGSVIATLTDDGVMTISGNGAMKNYEEGDTPYYDKKNNINTSIKTVVIKDGVTRIGNNAFLNCVSLQSATIPDSVTSIGELGFHCCASLTYIEIPDSVTKIERAAFGGCSPRVKYRGKEYTNFSNLITDFNAIDGNYMSW